MVIALCTLLLGFTLLTLFQDNAVLRKWDEVGMTEHFPDVCVFEGLVDVALNVVVLCMPLVLLRDLQMSSKTKWWLSGVFGLGAL